MSSPSVPATSSPEKLLAVACPACDATVAVDASLLGKAAECPLCSRGFRLPQSASTAPSPRDTPSRRRRSASALPAGGETPASGPSAAAQPAAAVVIGPAPDAPIAAPHDDETASLKRSAAERSVRRGRRNLVMLLAGGSLLLGIVMLLGRSRR